MSFFSFIFGAGGGKIRNALKHGAVVIDVRTPHEYDQGHLPGSVNIPVDRIKASVERIRVMKKPIILCCNSGERSYQAMNTLKMAGIQEVFNGGNWQRLIDKMP
jgi:rhodanese-related sulfurtransferase